MSKEQNANQYIFQDGHWIKVGKTKLVIEQEPGPTPPVPVTTETVRAVFMPAIDIRTLPIVDEDRDNRCHWLMREKSISTNSFLSQPLMYSEFDFSQHNYYFAYGNSKRDSGRQLDRQSKYSFSRLHNFNRKFNLPEPMLTASLKQERKKYSHQITAAAPTWLDFFTEIFSEDIVNYIDYSKSVTIEYKKWLYQTSHNRAQYSPRRNNNDSARLIIKLPISSFDTNFKSLYNNANLSMTNRARDKFNSANGHGYASCVLYIVRDVRTLSRSSDTQYIPGDVIAKFNLECISIYPDKRGGVLRVSFIIAPTIRLSNNRTQSGTSGQSYPIDWWNS